MGGIYASVNGKDRTCAKRLLGERGVFTLGGYANGYIWGTHGSIGSMRRLLKFKPVQARTVPALRVESGFPEGTQMKVAIGHCTKLA